MKTLKKIPVPPPDGDDYETPGWVYHSLDNQFNFQVDLAASSSNAKCLNYLDESVDALKLPWHKVEGWLWLNPPYSAVKLWIEKCQRESELGAKIMVLVPISTLNTVYFSKQKAQQRWIVVGRFAFEYNGVPIKGARGDSVFLLFNKEFKEKTIWVTKDELKSMGESNVVPLYPT